MRRPAAPPAVLLSFAVSLALATACGEDSAPGTADATLADTALVDAPPDGRPGADTPPPPVTFPNGVMSAAVRTDRATIWTRTSTTTDVSVRYSEVGSSQPTTTPPAAVTQATGFTVHVPLEGLTPDTTYSYEVIAGDGSTTPAATFKTAPNTDQPFRMAFSGDIDNDTSWYRLFDELEASGADLYVSLGDWPYGDSDPKAVSVSQYRAKHDETRRNSELVAWLRAMPVHAIWDDHEALNDWDGADNASQPERIAAAIQVWNEWFPITGADAGEIYRTHRWGPNVQLFYLDTRSHRDANALPDDGTKTMLGVKQRDWLLKGLSDSTAAFKLVLTSVPITQGTTGSDHWPGFASERDKIFDHIIDNGIGGVVFLTADQHWLAVHHMPQGMKEYQVGALARWPRDLPTSSPEWVTALDDSLNYGTLDYEPGSPPYLTFRAWGDGGKLLHEESLAAGRGSIQVNARDETESWRLDGPHVFVGKGTTTLPWASPGDYTITWRPIGPAGAPPETRSLADAGSVTFEDTTAGLGAPLTERLFDDGAIPVGWQVVDQGVGDPSSDWEVLDGALVESGNAYDATGGQEIIEKLGTFVRTTDAFTEGLLQARIFAGDDDSYGFMYSVGADDTYYRVSLDSQRSFARLVVVIDGVFQVLAEDLAYEPPLGSWQTLTVVRGGGTPPLHTVYVDGQQVLQAADDTLPSAGLFALYAYGMDDVRFDDVRTFGP